ncbi:hypothetical protein FNH22_10705 [Fulvivirga sp. M361]|uniref:hypothetical protein n=1 Tax=Fulvivirga sp. M361 TaxID=2594266 RepID=UPI00117A0F3D|nr:hypothetical protein [Fulvivirga sp. M361]TRX59607.1 hypothetical protein FNH22_10705 [Fulvivirga sp. M361]
MQGNDYNYRMFEWSGIFPLMTVLMLLLACTPEYLSEEALKAWIIEQEALTKSRAYKGFTTQVTYRPTDLLIAQELGGEEASSTEELQRLENKYSEYYYFILALSRGDKEALYQAEGGYEQFSDLVQTLSFRMGQYLNMTTSGQDTIEVADYVFPRTYGMGGATNLMFVFNKENAWDDDWIQLNLKEFGMGLGNQTFRFKRKDLEDVPRIKFKVLSTIK